MSLYPSAQDWQLVEQCRKEKLCVDTTKYPNENPGISPRGILNHYSEFLSEEEKEEIKNFPKVYCIPSTHTNVKASTNVAETRFYRANFYEVAIGDQFEYRYKIEEILGSGSFATVCRACDCKNKTQVTLRIVHKYAMSNYKTLFTSFDVQHKDPEGLSNFVRIKNYGHFRDHLFTVSDFYDMSLATLISKNPTGMPLEKVAKLGVSILEGLKFLHGHKIIHGNIKPSKILINACNPQRLMITDFSTAETDGLQYTTNRNIYENDLYYRAPELFCGSKYTTAIDMWAFGCVVAEMASGKVFLVGENRMDQFYLIQEVIKIPPQEFLDMFGQVKEFFFSSLDRCPKHVQTNGTIDFMYTNAATHRKRPGATPIGSFFGKVDKTLNHYILSTFKWMPRQRITVNAALEHPFFEKYVERLY